MYIIIHSRRKKKRKAQPLDRARKKGTVYRQCSEFEIRDEERNIYTGIKKKGTAGI
jgi:hypothetical protein